MEVSTMSAFPGKYREVIEDLSHKIWDLSEVEFETPQSAQACIEVLENHGFNVTKNIGGVINSFDAVAGNGSPHIGILVEYDALMGMSQIAGINEEKQDPSRKNGHACGHNLLGSAGILAGLKIKDILSEENLPGTIHIFGCPAEEIGYGKSEMARQGCFEILDCALSWHPNTLNSLWCDRTLAVRIFDVTFYGKSAHAAGAPEEGYSALDACELLNVGMNYYREHTLDGTRIHYAYQNAGGMAANVVPAKAKITYYLRAFSNDTLETMSNRFSDMVKGASLMTGTRFEIEERMSCMDFKPNHILAKALYEVMKEYGDLKFSDEAIQDAQKLSLLEGQAVVTKLEPMSVGNFSTISTDVGNVSHQTPTAQFFLACEPLGTPMHSWQWTANGKSHYAYEGIEHASEILTSTTIKLIKNPKILAEAKREHEGK